ncbi:TPA: hypothetical protein DCZ36_03510, partial [Candidatus Gracilibacteria bacterium]|nr:hypothetical protein [Candidatus Gracilibacteria bacterium]
FSGGVFYFNTEPYNFLTFTRKNVYFKRKSYIRIHIPMFSENTSPPISLREEIRRREETEEKRRGMNIELRQITEQEKKLHTALDEGEKLHSFQIITIIDNALDHINDILK